jgi:hypothetical protein
VASGQFVLSSSLHDLKANLDVNDKRCHMSCDFSIYGNSTSSDSQSYLPLMRRAIRHNSLGLKVEASMIFINIDFYETKRPGYCDWS